MKKYTKTARILHWFSAAVILWATVTGGMLAFFDINEALKQAIIRFNIATTALFIPVFAFRIVYAVFSSKPQPPNIARWNIRLARINHLLLYLTTAIVLLSGVLMMGEKIDLYGIFSINNPVSAPYWNRFFASLHTVTCSVLALLITIHVMAVIRHRLAGVKLISRMI